MQGQMVISPWAFLNIKLILKWPPENGSNISIKQYNHVFYQQIILCGIHVPIQSYINFSQLHTRDLNL